MAIKFLDSAGLTYFINKIVYGITSPKFSTGSTYAVGDFVIYTGALYRCTTAVTVAGAWSASKWVQTTVKGEIKALNTNLNGLTFAKDANGKWGYKVAGADPVIPFNSAGEKIVLTITKNSIGSNEKNWVVSGSVTFNGTTRTFSASTGGYNATAHDTFTMSDSDGNLIYVDAVSIMSGTSYAGSGYVTISTGGVVAAKYTSVSSYSLYYINRLGITGLIS